MASLIQSTSQRGQARFILACGIMYGLTGFCRDPLKSRRDLVAALDLNDSLNLRAIGSTFPSRPAYRVTTFLRREDAGDWKLGSTALGQPFSPIFAATDQQTHT